MGPAMKQIILSDCKAKELSEFGLSPEDTKKLAKYSNVNLSELSKMIPGLLIFPDRIGQYGDRTDNDFLFKIENNNCIRAGKVAGFFGTGSIQIQIRSQFDEDTPAQYFFQHMIRYVLNIYMLDLPTGSGPKENRNLLIYLFPWFLKRALAQGIFRTYRTLDRNDDHLRGAIDILRHLRLNSPFRGRIAYRTREHSGNNPLIHLIRHTIEALRTDSCGSMLLYTDENIRMAVRTIVELTPDFNQKNLPKVIAKNLRPVCHPYYTEFASLQNICMKILLHENNIFGQSANMLDGIVFRPDWLWQEYLGKVLDKAAGKFQHGEDNSSDPLKSIPIYRNKSKTITPDFFSSNIVIDAKYKHGVDMGGTGVPTVPSVKKEDRNQLITYLHVRKADAGFLIYPCNRVKKTTVLYEDGDKGKLYCGSGDYCEEGGSIGFIQFAIPTGAASSEDFQSKIRKSEEELIRIVDAHSKNTPTR